TPYLCSGASASCPVSCTVDANCIAADYCSGGSCVAKKANGSACAGGNECTSTNCADGFCCNSSDERRGDVCSAALGATANGTCTVIVAGSAGSPSCTPYVCSGSAASCPLSCTVDVNCISGDYCSAGACVAKKANGSACAGGNECTSTNCADGFCCN